MSEESKSQEATGKPSVQKGCLTMSLVGRLSIGISVAIGYAAQWIIGF
jgi:hypothetical protein